VKGLIYYAHEGIALLGKDRYAPVMPARDFLEQPHHAQFSHILDFDQAEITASNEYQPPGCYQKI